MLWNLTRTNTFDDRFVSFFFACPLQMLALNEILPFKWLKTVTNLFTYLNWPIEKCIRINWKRLNVMNSMLCHPSRCESNWERKKCCDCKRFDRNVYTATCDTRTYIRYNHRSMGNGKTWISCRFFPSLIWALLHKKNCIRFAQEAICHDLFCVCWFECVCEWVIPIRFEGAYY